MGILSIIGLIALLIVIYYLIITYIQTKDENDRELDQLIRNSSKCQRLITEYNLYCKERKGEDISIEKKLIGSNSDLRKIIVETRNFNIRKACENILKTDINELKSTRECIQAQIDSDVERKKEYRKRRKYAYKYELEIFKIFNDNNDSATKEIIIKSISNLFRLNPTESEILFQEWLENWLIQTKNNDKNKLELGFILTSNIGHLDENDLTYDIWKIKNKLGLGISDDLYKFISFKYDINLEKRAQVITLELESYKIKKIFKPLDFDFGTTVLVDENITIQEIITSLNLKSFKFPYNSYKDTYIGIKENEPIKILGWSKFDFINVQKKEI